MSRNEQSSACNTSQDIPDALASGGRAAASNTQGQDPETMLKLAARDHQRL